MFRRKLSKCTKSTQLEKLTANFGMAPAINHLAKSVTYTTNQQFTLESGSGTAKCKLDTVQL